MKVAVLLSTYNGNKYLNELLDSIYKQDLDGEIVVCIRDDGSKDNTRDIILKWKEKLDISLFEGKNVGPRDSFKELLRNAPLCDYYAFCDQDDIWHKDKLSSAVAMLQQQEEDVPVLYYCNTSLVDQSGNILKYTRDNCKPKLKYENLIVQNPALGCEMVFNNELRQIMERITFDYYYMHDVVAIEVAAVFGKIIYDMEPRMDYRQHIESVTQGHDRIKRFFDRIDFWFFQNNISISKQAKEILQMYPDVKDKETLKSVAEYRNGINRFRIAFDKKFKSIDYKCNRSFILRILLGVA